MNTHVSSNYAFVLSFLLLFFASPSALGVFGLELTEEQQMRREYYEADFDNSLRIAEALIAKDNPAGYYGKGVLLATGHGLPKDLKKAAELFSVAAKKDHGPSMVSLATMHLLGEGGLSSKEDGNKLLERAASLVHPETDARLAVVYAVGKAVEKDYKRAFFFAERAASKDDPLGLSVLGRLYLNGHGVEKDEEHAKKYLGAAAKQKEPYAMAWLAERYLKESDLKDAYRKLQAPVKHGIAPAEAMLGVMYLYGGPKFRADPRKAIPLLKSAAEKGNIRAIRELGEAYEKGRGVPKSSTLAAEWYFKAAEAYIKDENREQAIATLDKLESVAPRSAMAAELRSKLGEHARITPNSEANQEPTHIAGTGWFIEPGYVVTNNHVIAQSHVIKVRFKNGKSYLATVKIADANNDVAILSVSGAAKLPPAIPIASASGRPGERVFTIGFPIAVIMGSEPKVTDGIISSTRGYLDDPRLYQISVPIQPGNSGGPLINMNGEVIGIVTSKLAAAKVFQWTGDLPQNVNYALKVEYAQIISRSLQANSSTILSRGAAPLDVIAARVLPSVVQVIRD